MARSIRSRPLHLLLALALAASPSFAAVGRQAPAHTKAAAPASWASRTWSALQSLFGRSGAEMDPNGAKAKPTTSPAASSVQPPTSTDLGAEMDPDG